MRKKYYTINIQRSCQKLLISKQTLTDPVPKPKQGIHYLEELPPTEKKSARIKPCRNCASKKVKKETIYNNYPSCENDLTLTVYIDHQLVLRNYNLSNSLKRGVKNYKKLFFSCQKPKFQL